MGAPRRIQAPNPGPFTLEGTVSWVIGRHDVAVIDPGPDVESHVRALVAACAGAHRVQILLTHAHDDHAGAVASLVAALASQETSPSVEVRGNGHPDARFLNDGERLVTDGGDLVAIATPGHARGHMAFHHPTTGGLFAGDHILGSGDTTWVGEYPGCVRDYLASLERLRRLDLRVIHPGHGSDLADPLDAIDRFEQHRRERIEQVRTLMAKAGGDDLEALFHELYGGRVPKGLAGAARASLAALVEYVKAEREPSARLADGLVEALRRTVGDAAVITDPDRLLVYESDGLVHHRGRPAAVVLPVDTTEAAEVIRLLHQAGVPIVPRGAGTGLSGGAVPSDGCVVVGTARMNRILELDPQGRRARLQAGVVNARLSEAARPHGLHYAPDPSSQTACTIGGNVAENSGGPHCLKYGVTSRYVTALTVVDAEGRIVRIGGDHGAAHPDLVGLFVGSEGCFGLVTEVEVELIPIAPAVRTQLASFPTLEAAGAAVSALVARGFLPAALEILDRNTIRAVEESIFAAGYPQDAGAVLVAEFDGPAAAIEAEAAAARDVFTECGATEVREATTEAERAALWKGRKKAFGAMGRLAPDLLVQDATVPRSALPAVLAEIDRIAAEYEIPIANVFHAGDGNLHPNLVFDRRNPEQVTRVEAASKRIMEVCVSAGGTITGEHGVGLDKRDYMPLVHSPDELAMQRQVRRVFDPAGRWNPGKVLPDAARDAAAGDAAAGTDVRQAPAAAAESDAAASNAVVHYEPADLTITVGAGMPMDELRTLCARYGQWLPIDAPGVGTATAGAVVAAGLGGALAASHGAVRDLVLGLVLVTGDGRRLRLGGWVVKNVAGFDLLKLIVGSRGALGRITEITFRLFPLPARDVTLLVRDDDPGALAALADRLASSLPSPTSVELGWSSGGALLAVRTLGTSALAEATLGPLRALLHDAGVAFQELVGEAAAGARDDVRSGVTAVAAAAPTGWHALARTRGRRGQSPELVGRVPCGTAAWLAVDRAEVWTEAPADRTDARSPDADRGTRADAPRDWLSGLRRAFDPGGVLPPGPFLRIEESE